jgi:hypothetical protein
MRRPWVGSVVMVVLAMGACGHDGEEPGAVCNGAEIDAAVCRDATHMLTCRFFTWQVDTCRGPRGCSSNGPARARCDQREAVRGEGCGNEGARACSTDRAEVLECRGAEMVAVEKCRGARGCYRASADSPPSCDQGAALVGDPCDRGGSHCAADGRSVLTCSASSRYVKERSCSGPRGCRKSTGADGGYLVCDVSVGDKGERCAAPGATFCSSDGRQENTCEGGVLTLTETCPGGCAARWSDDGRSYQIECQ